MEQKKEYNRVWGVGVTKKSRTRSLSLSLSRFTEADDVGPLEVKLPGISALGGLAGEK
jgi:hypothetical protein